MKDLTILCDVDEVVADLLGEWIRRYNREYGDCLTPGDCTCWDMTQHVVPECGDKIYKFLGDPDIYDDVDPIPGAVEGVRALRAKGHRVVFVTSANPATMRGKVRWLENRDLLDGSPRPSDLIIAHDKSLIRGDVLIDDGLHNVLGSPNTTILFSRAHNLGTYHARRASGWDQVLDQVDRISAIK